ncbi:efflux RND transporter periplasmic adaptor subunit [Aliidiomarina celeris]|uniref:efflux RND transporter periplasmic adaptor subunit n=1 Tax=Aliidiomarina celeris TaxID=2249428 RepID=UPI000DE96F51|nr:efflux RND transporter periplasmic adaptor subunit [Aliidiomarina celeris]
MFQFLLLALCLPVLFVSVAVAQPLQVTQHQHSSLPHSHSVQEAESQRYTCSMHPSFVTTDPNERCPICGMELVPVSSNRSSGPSSSNPQISFSGRSLALLQVQTEPVRQGAVQHELEVIGELDFDERYLTSISAYTSGRIDRLWVNYTGAHVEQQAPLVEIYSPELLTAQFDLLQAHRQVNPSDDPIRGAPVWRESQQVTLRAARQRLRLLGLSNAQIDQVITRGEATDRMVVQAPGSGQVVARHVRQGDYVTTGEVLLELVDPSKMWAVLQVFERDLTYFNVGDAVTVQPHIRGTQLRETQQGEVVSIAPRIDPQTRTRNVHVALENTSGALSAGGFIRATLSTEQVNVLTIPASAPLLTGTRAVVYVQNHANEEQSTFSARTVTLGRKFGDRYEVLSGLNAGDLVVTRGAFRIDAELQLQGHTSMMNPAPQQQAEQVNITSLVAPYLGMWEALQSDNLAAWQQAAADFYNGVAAVEWPPSLATEQAQLEIGAGHAHHVADISTARQHFYEHSQAMISLARAGYHQGTLYLMYCPMARQGEGAYWLQANDQLRNPYYGAMMLRCGDLIEPLEGAQQ